MKSYYDSRLYLESLPLLITRQMIGPRGDRFIPWRTDLSSSGLDALNRNPQVNVSLGLTPAKSLGFLSPDRRLLTFSKPALKKEDTELLALRDAFFEGTIPTEPLQCTRKPAWAYRFNQLKTYEAPGLRMDFYSNLISCSKDNHFYTILNTGDGFQVYGAHLTSRYDIDNLFSFPIYAQTPYCVKAFASQHVLSGWGNNHILMYDVTHADSAPVQTFQLDEVADHLNTGVKAIDMIDDNAFVAISPDGGLGVFDKRQSTSVSYQNILMTEGLFSTMVKPSLVAITHNQEQKFVISTKRGSILNWDMRQTSRPIHLFEDDYHFAETVKGMAFNPRNCNLLATGGGIDSRQVVLRDIRDNTRISSFSTQNQITGMLWLNASQLVVSLGFHPASGTTGLLMLEKKSDQSLRMIARYEGLKGGRFLFLDTLKNALILGVSDESIRIFDISQNRPAVGVIDGIHHYARMMR